MYIHSTATDKLVCVFYELALLEFYDIIIIG